MTNLVFLLLSFSEFGAETYSIVIVLAAKELECHATQFLNHANIALHGGQKRMNVISNGCSKGVIALRSTTLSSVALNILKSV